MDILLNGDKVDALSFIVHRDFVYERGKRLSKIKNINSTTICQFRRLLVKKLLHEQTLNLWAKMFYLNVMVEISVVNENF